MMSTEKEPSDAAKHGQYLIDDALRLIGFGKLHYKITFLCGIMSLSVVNQIIGMMMIMTASQCDLELSTENKGLLTSMSYFGLMLFAYMWGYLSDTKGRRTIMMIAVKGWIVAALLSSFAPNFSTMLVCRFFTGVFTSGVTACFYPYVSEFTSSDKRSVVMGWVTFIGGTAHLYVPLAAWGILSMDFSWEIWDGFAYRPWRLILIVLILPLILGVIMLNGLPESPKFLLSQGHKNKALKTLHWIYEYNSGKSALTMPVQDLLPDSESLIITVDKSDGCLGIWKKVIGQTAPLLKPPFVRNFFILIYIQISLFSVGVGSAFWFTEIQNRLSKSGKESTICDIINLHSNDEVNTTTSSLPILCDDHLELTTFINTIILGSFAVVGLFIISILMKPLGRGTIMFIWLLISALSGLALQWVTNPLLLIVLYSMFLTIALTAISVTYGACVMLFPTYVRSTAVSITALFGRLSSSFTSIIIGMTIESYCNYTFGVVSALVGVAACLTLLLPIKKLNK